MKWVNKCFQILRKQSSVFASFGYIQIVLVMFQISSALEATDFQVLTRNKLSYAIC